MSGPPAWAAITLGLVLFAGGLWAAVSRLIAKPPQELTQLDRMVGTMLIGRNFGRLHARWHARGFRLTPGSAPGLALLVGLALLCALALYSISAAAQQELPPNGVLLVAKPGLNDPNFGRSVVLVTQAPDYSTVGVILNRPTSVRYQGKPVWLGGPVMRQVVVAVFHSEDRPKAAAFHVLRNVYLSMHPEIVDGLIADDKARYRLYGGFSGWAPRQLESEFQRDGWYVMPADEGIIFREDTSKLWEELVARATVPRT
ncbi:MAG TPA: YqgE/AlgH family protein [Burkholderiales bacterium]|nr:YqgE/AlgH family protein [Burkholderiales bacterium]